MKADKKFVKGRAGLILSEPFFGSLALRLKIVEDPSAETAWTDGVHLGYNPEWIESLNADMLKGLICHEVMHCALQHHTRRGERDPKKWNAAADYVINPLIVDAGMSIPPGGLLDRRFGGMSAEQVYAQLPDPNHNGGGGQGSGSGFGEVRDAKEPGTGDPNDPASGQTAGKAEMRKQSQDWKVALSQAVQQAKTSGNLPGGIERIVEDILEPKLDWREILHRFVDTAAKNDYSWSRPNRRHIGNGIYLPAMYSNELGRVAIGVDVSGSIDQNELNEFAGEINSILQDYRADCKVIYCDTDVRDVDEFAAGDPVELHVTGGGGTDFRPPFNYLDEQGEVPALMLYFTDGECSRFPEEPGYPVLWVRKPYGSYSREFTPPFGEVLEL